MRARAGWLIAALGLSLLLCIAAARLTVPTDQYGDLDDAAVDRYVGLALAAGVFYLAGVAVVRAWAVPRWALWLGLGAGLLARVVMVATPPVLSTDLYRYVWDGRVQAQGINPYRYIPADPALAFLRDGLTGPEAIFININRPETARTIYPPAGANAVCRDRAGLVVDLGGQLTMMGLDLVAGAAAFALLLAAGRPAAWLLIWAWNPLAIMEFSGAGHIDAASMAASRSRCCSRSGNVRAWPGPCWGWRSCSNCCRRRLGGHLAAAQLAGASGGTRGDRGGLRDLCVGRAAVAGLSVRLCRGREARPGRRVPATAAARAGGAAAGVGRPGVLDRRPAFAGGIGACHRAAAWAATRRGDRGQRVAAGGGAARHNVAALSLVFYDVDHPGRGSSSLGCVVADSFGAAALLGFWSELAVVGSHCLHAVGALVGWEVSRGIENA